MLSGDNGILQKATEAKINTDNAQIKEIVQLAYTAAIADGNGVLTEQNLRTELTKEFGEKYNLSEDTTTNEWVISVNEVERLRVSIGSVEEDGINIETLQTATTKPYLPSDSFHVSDVSGEQSVNDGLVITDGENEFVWIEVPMTETVYPNSKLNISAFTDAEYISIATDLANYANSIHKSQTTLTGHLPPSDKVGTDYTGAYKNVLKSIYQNGGFYIGRYETGIDGTEESTTSARDFGTDYSTEHEISENKAVIKANVQPYTWVRWGQAQSLSQDISSGAKTSSLLFGVQWDLVLKFLKEKDNGLGDEELYTNSSNWGNYCLSNFAIERGKYAIIKNNGTLNTEWTNEDTPNFVENGNKVRGNGSYDKGMVLITTGANISNNCKSNIYDLAGNVNEWTIENTTNTSRPCALRGGNFLSAGYSYPASYHGNNNTSASYNFYRL